MPVTYLTKTQEREARTEKVLRTGLVNRNINQRALANKLKKNYWTLNKRINDPGTCTLTELWAILDELEIPAEDRAKILL